MSIDNIYKKAKFLIDKAGHRTHVLLPIKEYEELVNDLEGLAITRSRRNEETISLDEMKRRLYEKQEVQS